MKAHLSFLLFLVALNPALAQNEEARDVLKKYQSARPTDDELAVYKHDWVPTLKDALAKAKKEERPIFFIWNTNISGPTNFFSGHC